MTSSPLSLPDSMQRADIGPYMASLREHYGLTAQEVSERLHIRIRYLKAIEESKFAELPGVVYARGYVSTYAEFLGLNADQVVERCFGVGLAHETQTYVIPEPARKANRATMPKNWLTYVAVGVFALGVLSLLGGGSEETLPVVEKPQQAQSNPVSPEPPKALVMPSARNHDCLYEGQALACFYATRTMQRWVIDPAVPAYQRFAPRSK